MMKSKIPLPSKRPAQSSIPLPTKSLGIQSKKWPSNSKEAVASKKLVSKQQAPSNSSKVKEKQENVVKRLPKSYDSKKVAVLNKKTFYKSCDVQKVVDNKITTENKLIKQTKPVPVRPKVIVSKPEPKTNNENQSRRFSSLKPHNGKNAVLSNNKPRTTIKSAIQTKSVNPAKKLNKISTNNSKENTNRNLLMNEKKEKVEKVSDVAPIKQINVATKCGVDDSEFKDSRFFKSLILTQRELSPGIIKYCSKAKLLSPGVKLLQPPQKSSFHFQTADEFVEEVKRISSKYHRLNGRLVLQSPVQLKHKEMSAEDFVEEVKRNSERFRQRKRNWIHSPGLVPKNSFQRMAQDIVSVKENLDIKLVDEVRRLSEFRKQPLQNVDSFMTNRRWTCNLSSKPSIANMNPTELAAELQRVSEIRRESGAQIYKKGPFLEQNYSVEKLNPHQKVLREMECLTAKKRDRIKKKVTFSIPSPGSPHLTASASAKTEAKLSDISEGSSHTCTPEFDLGCGKVKSDSQSNANNAGDTSVITTPELNLTSYKLDFDSSPKEINETLPFDILHKNNASTNDNQTVSLKTEGDVFIKNSEQCSQNPKTDPINLNPDFLSSKFSSLKIIGTDVCISQDTIDSNLSSFGNYMTNTNNDSYTEFSNLKSTDCLFPSVQRLAVPSHYQPVNETGKFSVNVEKKIYTPHPVNLHSKSNLPSSVSPSFLSQKFSTLNSLAPICTPMVLKNLSHSPEVNLNHIRQKLDFNEKPNHFIERRESQIILQTIPTVQKMNDYLCDQECIILSSQSSDEDVFIRNNLKNPIAVILNNGDEMHFIPISTS